MVDSCFVFWGASGWSLFTAQSLTKVGSMWIGSSSSSGCIWDVDVLQNLQKDSAASSGVSSANGHSSPWRGGSIVEIFWFFLLSFEVGWREEEGFCFLRGVSSVLFCDGVDIVRGDCLAICCGGIELLLGIFLFRGVAIVLCESVSEFPSRLLLDWFGCAAVEGFALESVLRSKCASLMGRKTISLKLR